MQLEAQALQSSTIGPDFAAQKAIDGNPDTYSQVETGSHSAYWLLAWERPITLNEIR
eukprot:Ihof_evm1s1441 gene=Ihof_evmTU1s1441